MTSAMARMSRMKEEAAPEKADFSLSGEAAHLHGA